MHPELTTTQNDQASQLNRAIAASIKVIQQEQEELKANRIQEINAAHAKVVSDKDSEIANRDGQIRSLEQTIEQLKSKISGLEGDVQSGKDTIGARDKTIEAQNTEIDRLKKVEEGLKGLQAIMPLLGQTGGQVTATG